MHNYAILNKKTSLGSGGSATVSGSNSSSGINSGSGSSSSSGGRDVQLIKIKNIQCPFNADKTSIMNFC